MSWREQQIEVARLSAEAQTASCEAAAHKNALRKWRQQAFGSANTLAWSFAAGTMWGVARRSGTSRSRVRRAAIAAANTSWFAWRLANSKTT